MKRIFAMSVIFAAIVFCGCFKAAAATDYTVNDKVTAVLADDGTLTVSGKGAIDQSPWYESDRYKIKKIVVSKGITSIDDGAFFGCSYVTNVSVNATVKTIGSGAFANDYCLNSITGMSGVTEIGDYAFQNCAFTSFTFPSSVKTIGNGIFYGCSNLTSISIPASAESIGTVGYQCYGLTSITVAANNPNFASEDGLLFSKDKTVLYSCPAAKTGTYNIPSGVVTVNDYAFTSSSLTNIAIPSTVKTLGRGAFYQSDITSLNVPDSVTSVDDFWANSCTNLESVTIGTGLKALGYSAFRGDSALKTVVLGKNIVDLDTLTFVDCTSLVSVNIPEGVTQIGGSVFYNCSSLTEITLPSSLKSIGGMSFLKTGLTSVTIPKNVTYVAHNAFPDDTVLNLLGDLRKQEDGSYMRTKNVPIDVTYYYDMAFEVLDIVNSERASEGLSALKMDKELLNAAMMRAAETSVYWSHTRPTGMDCFTACDKMFRENIAAGSRTAAGVMNQWMNSPGHRANILSEDSKCIGIGVVSVNGTYYWVQCFGYTDANTAKKSSYKNSDATVQVIVRPDYEYFILNAYPESVTFEKGDTQSTYLYVYNDWVYNYINPDYVGFKSSNKSVCKVSSKGVITAVGAGSANVTVYIKSEPELSVTIPVKVNLPKPELTLANTKNGITVKWGAISDADGYYVYRKTKDTSWTTLQKITSNTTVSYSDTEVKDDSGTVYYYTVRAYKGSDKSSFYANVYITRLTTPSVTVANALTGVTVKWSKADGASGYYVYRKLEGGSWERITTENESASSYTDKSIKSQSGKVFYYSVKAYCKDGTATTTGSYVTDVKIRWLAPPTVSLSNITSGVKVKWSKITGATGYIVYRKTASGSWSKLTSISNASTVTYTDKKAAAGTVYYYSVRAVSDDSNSSNVKNVSIKRLTTPTVKLSNLSSGIRVKWTKVTGAAGYYVYRKTASGSWQKIKTISGASTLSYTDTAVKNKNGVTYYYTVKAYSGSWCSSYVTNVKIKRA